MKGKHFKRIIVFGVVVFAFAGMAFSQDTTKSQAEVPTASPAESFPVRDLFKKEPQTEGNCQDFALLFGRQTISLDENGAPVLSEQVKSFLAAIETLVGSVSENDDRVYISVPGKYDKNNPNSPWAFSARACFAENGYFINSFLDSNSKETSPEGYRKNSKIIKGLIDNGVRSGDMIIGISSEGSTSKDEGMVFQTVYIYRFQPDEMIPITVCNRTIKPWKLMYSRYVYCFNPTQKSAKEIENDFIRASQEYIDEVSVVDENKYREIRFPDKPEIKCVAIDTIQRGKASIFGQKTFSSKCEEVVGRGQKLLKFTDITDRCRKTGFVWLDIEKASSNGKKRNYCVVSYYLDTNQ
jgi:hypothetical protein